MTVDIGRIYDNKDNTDAIRILVDRVWPRGISKRTANLDYWLKDIAPSTELRQWFQHDPKLYGAFKEKYEKELRDNETQKEAFEKLKAIVNQHHHVLLLYSAYVYRGSLYMSLTSFLIFIFKKCNYYN